MISKICSFFFRRSTDCSSGQPDHNGERGAALVEYVVLAGAIAVLSSAAVSLFGNVISANFGNAAQALSVEEAAGIGTCPNGWVLIGDNQTKKNGQSVDANGDGFICRKDIPGKGNGNTNQNQNVKDNNGPPASIGG